MVDLTFHERRHLQKLLQQQGSIKYIFDEFVRKVGQIMTGWSDSGSENVWIRNANIERAIENELAILREKLLENIQSHTTDAWERSNLKTDELVSGFIDNLPINETIRKGVFARNEEAFSAFMKRKVDGFTISDRVWKVTGTAKENIEHYLSSGLSTGRPAALISQDVRQLLKEPDRRFHRIRNADGKLVPSAPMAAYHPGQGVYRSSYKNALRLAVTNTNEMYRLADHERWKNLDFILGVDIRRSASNKGPCPICDAMVGKYPKDFVYKGWHPFCICPATPILMKEDDFIKSITDENYQMSGQITELPENGRAYLEEQAAKSNLKTDSYLLRDNKKYFNAK